MRKKQPGKDALACASSSRDYTEQLNKINSIYHRVYYTSTQLTDPVTTRKQSTHILHDVIMSDHPTRTMVQENTKKLRSDSENRKQDHFSEELLDFSADWIVTPAGFSYAWTCTMYDVCTLASFYGTLSPCWASSPIYMFVEYLPAVRVPTSRTDRLHSLPVRSLPAFPTK